MQPGCSCYRTLDGRGKHIYIMVPIRAVVLPYPSAKRLIAISPRWASLSPASDVLHCEQAPRTCFAPRSWPAFHRFSDFSWRVSFCSRRKICHATPRSTRRIHASFLSGSGLLASSIQLRPRDAREICDVQWLKPAIVTLVALPRICRITWKGTSVQWG